MNKSYSEMLKLKTLEERFEYLKLDGVVGQETFGNDRWINQQLYQGIPWRTLRANIIVRDNGCELGIEGLEIVGKVFIHHINPITANDILTNDPKVYDPENLVTVSFNLHQAIHYADLRLWLLQNNPERSEGDTTLWKGGEQS